MTVGGIAVWNPGLESRFPESWRQNMASDLDNLRVDNLRVDNLRVDNLRVDNLRVVLVAARNPLNIGAAARAMSNFGVRRLRVVNPYEVAFQEARSAVGAAGVLAKAEQYANVAEAVADCRLVVGTTAAARRELQHRLLRLDKGGLSIKRQLKTGPPDL